MRPFSLNIGGELRNFESPLVMGILNVTPDSFYPGSRTYDKDSIKRRITTLLEEGADIIDIGGCSTRPGAEIIEREEEMERVSLGFSLLREIAGDILVSVDTFRSDVAAMAVREYGCDIVNDVSGGNLDDAMFETVASLKVPYVLSHMRGTPADMQTLCQYDNVTADVLKELSERFQKLSLMGVSDVIIDPGIGFAKTLDQNYTLINQLETFEIFNCPIMIGISRKGLIYKMLDIKIEEALEATTALNALCLDRGASILRVHDVAAARHCVSVYQAVNTHCQDA